MVTVSCVRVFGWVGQDAKDRASCDAADPSQWWLPQAKAGDALAQVGSRELCVYAYVMHVSMRMCGLRA